MQSKIDRVIKAHRVVRFQFNWVGTDFITKLESKMIDKTFLQKCTKIISKSRSPELNKSRLHALVMHNNSCEKLPPFSSSPWEKNHQDRFKIVIHSQRSQPQSNTKIFFNNNNIICINHNRIWIIVLERESWAECLFSSICFPNLSLYRESWSKTECREWISVLMACSVLLWFVDLLKK